MKILITGAAGFIGKNLVSHLRLYPDKYEILEYTEDSKEKIEDFLDKADFIFHLAGVNRPKDDKDFKTGNTDLTEKIITHLKKSGKNTPVLLTSSIQAVQDNPYGKSKLAAERIISSYSKETGATCFTLRLPNVFGKWSKPNYNSAVATFCYNLTHNLPIKVNDESADLNLIYIDDVIDIFIKCLEESINPNKASELISSKTFHTTVGEVADTIKELVSMRETLIVPDLSNKLTKYLYSTLTSFYDTNDLIASMQMNSDERGWLFELAKSKEFGQIFVSQTNPGYSRGEHWHHTKVERFCIIKGQGEMHLRDVGTDEIRTYKLSDQKMQIIDTPIGVIHAIENTGKDDMIMVIWANEILNKDSPDTYWEKVKK